MNISLLLSILSALLPLTGAVPGHGHSHAHVHRDFHDHIQQRDQGHTHHGHVHNRDVLDDQQPAIKPRAPPSSGCGRRPKAKGTGKGKPVFSSSLLPSSGLPAAPSNSSGGVFATSDTDAIAASTSSASEISSPTIVVPEIPVTTAASSSSTTSSSSSSLEAVETPQVAVASDIASASSSVLEAFQGSYTLATRTSASPATASTSEAATITASSTASGSDSGSGSGAQTGDIDNLTVVVRNMMADTLTTSHAMNADLPAHVLAITATLTDGTMPPGASATMIYPSGWAGNMFAAKAATSDDEVVDLADGSLIEGSFVPQMGDTPVNDMDVSYV